MDQSREPENPGVLQCTMWTMHSNAPPTAPPAGTPFHDEEASRFVTLPEFRSLLAREHPFAALLGAEVVSLGCGSATVRMAADPAHLRLGGIISGPMLMGLADLALYAAIVGATGNPEAVTASLTIHFLRKAPAGGIVARASVLKTGRLTSGEVTLFPEAGGEPVAHAISTWSIPRRNGQQPPAPPGENV